MKWIVLLAFFPVVSIALETWTSENKIFLMERHDGILFSKNCIQKKKRCLAWKAFSNKSKKALSKEDLHGGKNPGAVICKKFYQSEVFILRNENEQENAFCRFKDGSLVSSSLL